MAYAFGDSFDLYAASADLGNFWENWGVQQVQLPTGRFSGSRGCSFYSGPFSMTKTSSVNDSIHHICGAFKHTDALSGTNVCWYFTLLDGSTAQCTIQLLANGTINLCSGATGGTVIATYVSAVTLPNLWTHFEFEVVINNTTGSFKVRKDGSSTDSHSTTGLNTRASANNYANKITIGVASASNMYLDDFFWKSDTSSFGWLGDTRCYVRMPASDVAGVAFLAIPATISSTVGVSQGAVAFSSTTSVYHPWTPTNDGAVTSVVLTNVSTGFSGTVKCSIFASSGGVPTTVLASATNLVNPVTGANTITFPSPPPVVKSTPYFIGFVCSATVSNTYAVQLVTDALNSTVAYAAFPTASPTTTTGAYRFSGTVNLIANYNAVKEVIPDFATSYVYSATPGAVDFYTIDPIAITPAAIYAVSIKGYVAKSDAGTRTACLQMKSGATTVATSTLTLSTSWQGLGRTDATDPNTGVTWTAAGVNALQVGPKCVA